GEHDLVDPERAEPARRSRDGPGREELRHPARVRGGNEVERPAHRPGADDRTVRERSLHVLLARRREPQAHGPQRAEVVLSLHGAEPGDRLFRPREGGRRDALRGEPPANDFRRSHEPLMLAEIGAVRYRHGPTPRWAILRRAFGT